MNEPNKSAQSLGRMGKGKPKNISPEERERRRERARGLAAKRWPVKGEKIEDQIAEMREGGGISHPLGAGVFSASECLAVLNAACAAVQMAKGKL